MKDRIKKVLDALGLKKAARDLTSEEQTRVAKKYQEMFSSDLLDDLNNEVSNKKKAEQYDAVFSLLSDDEDSKSSNLQEAIIKLKEKTAKLEADVKTLGSKLEPDNSMTGRVAAVIGGRHSATHLFGVEHSLFSLDKRWNRVMINPKIAKLDDLSATEDDKIFSAFKAEAAQYGESIAKRMQQLHNLGIHPKKEDTFTQTYTALEDAGLGDQFVVYRQDQLISRIQELPNVYDIFPRRFGVQDREVMTNAFLGEASQAYQTGEAWKGSLTLMPEIGYVEDAMFKTKFEGMKWLERRYVGYLNREGSDPMKWSLIEWTILQIATQLTMEQFMRRIQGVFVKPVATEPGNYLHASTGFKYTLQRFIHENKLLVFDDAGLATYDNVSTNMVDWAIALYDKVKEKKENFQENQYAMYLNLTHKYCYLSQYRAKYGLQQDFTGTIANFVPDTNLQIIWVPNLGQDKLGVIAKPGNFQCLENLPGEMLNIRFQADMESYKAWSVWKEGFSAEFVGKKFDTPALLAANEWALQEVFMNKPITALADGATAAVGATNFWFKTVANSAPTAFLGITGPKEGIAYVLECQGLANATTVAQAALFSTITAAYTPTTLGDYLMFVWDATASKYFELERCVAGVRTVNETKNPNIPGGR
jgi:hypothetical protein